MVSILLMPSLCLLIQIRKQMFMQGKLTAEEGPVRLTSLYYVVQGQCYKTFYGRKLQNFVIS
jgi:hypothetical protein